ncbi:MAG TPA: deoxyribonuclease V [Gemmatimonadales bacterium]|nr:deoxyribonuclease V [Gemmatimonadales bacterium]
MEIQRRLCDRVIPKPPPRFKPRLIAGADVSMERFGDHAWAGIVVLDARSLETVETASAEAELRFPYIPGLLSFRELPPLAAAWARLRRKPDVLIFDGVGYAHPRRFGIASHGGVLFDVPSIGCAKSILVGTPGPLAPERGATAELVDKGEVVGMAVRLRERVAPVYVSRGHRMDLKTAVRIVESVSRGYRLPETTRRAHALVNELRRQSR